MAMLEPLGQLFQFIGKRINLAIIFEVVDDPEDGSPYFHHTKPIDVWVCVLKKQVALKEVTKETMPSTGNWACIPRITKATPMEVRQYGFKSTEEQGWLYVIAAPTPEWTGFYKDRQYDTMVVKPGKAYNFSVSVPAIHSAPAKHPGGGIHILSPESASRPN